MPRLDLIFKSIGFILCLNCTSVIEAQTIKQIDSVAYMMCDYLKDLKIDNDTLKIKNLYQSQLYPYLGTLPQGAAKEVGSKIYYRLQRNCNEFLTLLDRLEPPKNGVQRGKQKLTSIINTSDLQTFKAQKEFYYLELDGTKVTVDMNNGLWEDHFMDGSFSKLSYKWISAFEFELSFIESNNTSRSALSVPGDLFVYQVLSKEKDHYMLTVHIPGQEYYDKFKLFFKE